MCPFVCMLIAIADPDHAKFAKEQTARHEFETYEVTQGLQDRSQTLAQHKEENDGKLR